MRSTRPPTAPLVVVPVPGGAPPLPSEIAVPAERPRGRWGVLVLAAGLLCIGANLRIGVASVGPVLGDIRSSLALSAAAASLLTTVPVLAFGAFAFVTPGLSRRLGMHRLLGVTMAVLATGLAVRLAPHALALVVGTVLVGAAIAVANVVMPAAIKQDFAQRAGLMMGLYSTVLFIGAAVASGATAPILHAFGEQWQPALAMWAIPALAALLLWVPQLRRSPGMLRSRVAVADAPGERGEPPFRAILTDPVALAVTGFMGLQSISYYATLTWAPSMLHDAGLTHASAGWMVALSALPAVLASLVTPALAARVRPAWLLVAAAVVLTGTAYLGLALSPANGTVVWMTMLGLGQGASISLSLSTIVWRSPNALLTGHLSTMAQGFGYLLAAAGPIGVGWLHGLSDEWTLPLAALGVLLVGQLVVGALASRPVHVLDAPATPLEGAEATVSGDPHSRR